MSTPVEARTVAEGFTRSFGVKQRPISSLGSNVAGSLAAYFANGIVRGVATVRAAIGYITKLKLIKR